MINSEIGIHEALKTYFGFNTFKGLQEEVIKSVMANNNTFVIMPTGGGKSFSTACSNERGNSNCCFATNCLNEKSS